MIKINFEATNSSVRQVEKTDEYPILSVAKLRIDSY